MNHLPAVGRNGAQLSQIEIQRCFPWEPNSTVGLFADQDDRRRHEQACQQTGTRLVDRLRLEGMSGRLGMTDDADVAGANR